MSSSFNPWRDRGAAVKRLLKARKAGHTLSESAAAAGVHVATVCRWQARNRALRKAQARNRALRKALLDASASGYRLRHPFPPRSRPRVIYHPFCPECGAAVEVRRAGGWPALVFWRCSRWPVCGWASWRPRHLVDCRKCRGPRYWSYSRQSVGCPRCGTREMAG
jgi:hypothetical protein